MSTPQTWEGQQPHAIGSQHMASQPRPQGKIIRNVLAHPSKLICTKQRQYMALKTSLDNPRRKASFFTGQFKALLVTHWCHFEVSLKPFPAVFLLSLIAQQCSPGHATVIFASLVVNALIFWVLYLIFTSPQSLFLFIALWNIYLYPKIHLVLPACPMSHLSAHTFFNSAAHSLIIHQSIYTFLYPSSHSPSLSSSLAVLSPLSFLQSSPACLLWALQPWLSQSTKQCVTVYHPALKTAMKHFTAHQSCRPRYVLYIQWSWFWFHSLHSKLSQC